MRQADSGVQLSEQEKLFLSLVEQLSRPLASIVRLSELVPSGGTAESTADHWQLVQTMAASSLYLTESYALSLRVHGKLAPLQLEPVTVSSLLYDTAEKLAPLAKQYGVELRLDTGFRLRPVVADRAVLQHAFNSLGQVFITAQAQAENSAPVSMLAHRSRYGIVTGMYGQVAVSADNLRRAYTAQAKARQPLPQLVSGPAAGVFVADHLLHALETKLHAARYHHMTGLATTLQPSWQLQLV